MNHENPLVQIVIRAAWITFWMILIAFLLTKPIGYSFTIDPVRQFLFSLVVSSIVQIFQKPNQQDRQSKKRTYLDVVTELLHGDEQAAIRLFNYTKDKFGGKTDEWIWQKVIRDIERDRR